MILQDNKPKAEVDKNNKYESVYSTKVRAGKRRTYFFDVRKTKGEDFYITITESTKRFDQEGYDRHKIFLYKEDFNRFFSSLEETMNHVKENLMPDYDYDEFTKKHEEWEAQKALENELGSTGKKIQLKSSRPEPLSIENETQEEPLSFDSEDDISW